jgi:hypothetical protein
MAEFNDDKINGIWQEVMPTNQKSDSYNKMFLILVNYLFLKGL